MRKWPTTLALCGLVISASESSGSAKEKRLPIPDKLVVLTFDDGNKSDIAYVAPLLKRYGFGATFFITEGLGFLKDKKTFLTWDEVRKLDERVFEFEIGNHTQSHPDLTRLSKKEVLAQVEHIERRCGEHGISAPRSFCYPGWHHSRKVVEVLLEKGYLFARRGSAPEFPQEANRGIAYDPTEDHPLLIPTTGVSGPNWRWEDFLRAVRQAKDGKICVLTFHGVPALIHPRVNTKPNDFARYMKYLHDEKYTVIALRDLARYVDPAKRPGDPYAPIERRLGVTPMELKCEYTVNPLGIDTPQPRFSWTLESVRRGQKQSAYQILVAGSEQDLESDTPDKWDSRKATSGKSINVAYDGKALSSGEKCWWKVRCWPALSGAEGDKDGKVSAWSKPATFEMGLLKPGDWRGKWIGARKDISAPLLRKEFKIAGKVKRARAYLSGLGWCELYINGRKVGDHVLDPATSYYNNDQPVRLGSRVLYVTLDATDYLKKGRNAVGVMLGNGWYSHDGQAPGRQAFADSPKLILQLDMEFTDGTSMSIVSDDTWKASGGPITANEICLGEHYDARLEKTGWKNPNYDDSGWGKTVLAEPPSGVLVAQMLPPVKVMRSLKPVKITKPGNGVYIYDFGQHFSGWTRLRASGPKGTRVTLRHAGAVAGNGRLDTKSQRGAPQTDTYILKGEGVEVWEPRFTLHGFRYVEMTGFPGTPTAANLEGRFVYNSVETTGSFECSNPLLNRIHRNVCWTFMTSLQGIPQDAADRSERVGWLGDTGFVAEDYMYNFDTAAFWAKWLNDIKDSQKPNGDVPVVSPLHWRNPYSWYPCWKSTYPLIAWYLYRYYGDERVLVEHYDGMKKLVDFLGTKARRHIIPNGLGDHMEPDRASGKSTFRPRRTPATLTSTAYYYYDSWIVARTAEIIGKADEAKRYSDRARRIKKAFIAKFLDEKTNQYATGSQTSNAVALYLGLVPAGREQAVLKNLVDDIMIKNDGHLSTGILGTNALEQVLGEHGRADVMYKIATRTTYPSWGYTISKGATTVWESFEDDNHSLNMKMFGSTEKFFYKDLAGISPAGPGYERITIKPCPVGDLTYAKASLRTVRGLVSSHWKKTDKSLSLQVVIPVNSSAKISVPRMGLRKVVVKESSQTIWRAGKFIKGVSGITAGDESKDYVTFDVGSGSYVFRLTGQ